MKQKNDAMQLNIQTVYKWHELSITFLSDLDQTTAPFEYYSTTSTTTAKPNPPRNRHRTRNHIKVAIVENEYKIGFKSLRATLLVARWCGGMVVAVEEVQNKTRKEKVINVETICSA